MDNCNFMVTKKIRGETGWSLKFQKVHSLNYKLWNFNTNKSTSGELTEQGIAP